MAQTSVSLTAGPDDGAYVPGALGATADQFLGEGSGGTPGGGTPGGGTGLGGRLQRDQLSPGSDTPYHVTANRGLGLRVQQLTPLAGQTLGLVALSLARGQHDYLLPQGLGPLSDPTHIDFSTTRLAAEIGLARDWQLAGGQMAGRARLRLSLVGGQEVSWTRTHIHSALLSVHNRHQDSAPYLAFGAGLTLPAQGGPRASPRIELHGTARLRPSGRAMVSAEIRLTPSP